jgi:DNA polymerase II large subunit
MIGHLVIGLAPHTSAGVIGRIIGVTDARVCFAHPLWHNIKRRDCDGDEDAVMLALDPLINFSKKYLPSQIGGIMDALLLIISTVNPLEVDEAKNIDVAENYPLDFYVSTQNLRDAKKNAFLLDIISNRLGTQAQFTGYKYSHEISDINLGNHESTYIRLGSMLNKVNSQLKLADKIKAVDASEVAERVLTTHFIRDIVGNLRAFTVQKFRCKKCNRKYRRIPLSGKCPRCKGEVVLTVHRGGIEKYLNVSEHLVKRYGIREYYKQRIELVREEIRLLFKSRERQISISEFIK